MSLVNLDSPSFRTGSTTQMSSSENEMCSDEPPNEEDEEERMSSPEDELMEPKGMDGLVTEGHRAQGDERSFGMRDMAQIWQLKKVFSGMEEEYERKINAVDISRADLKFCQERLELLQLQRNELEQKLTMAEEESNRPAADLTRAQLVKVDETVGNETELEKTLREAVKEAELMLLKADMEVSGYVDAMRTLEEDEADIKLMKMKQYNDRLAKEDQLMERFLLRKRNLERKQRKEMLDKEEQRKKALLEAKRAHEVTVALMQESLEKERARKESEEAESRQLLEKRVSAVLSLKKNIDAQREVMKKSQSARNSKIATMSQRESELDAADSIKQKRLEEFSKQKEKFDRVRRDREVDIAHKLIKEEERLKQMKEKLNQPHWKPRDSSMPTKPQKTTKKSKPMQGKQERQKEKSGVDDEEESSRGVQSDGPLHSVVLEERPVGTSEVAREEKDRPVEEDKVICPEFDGLWSGPVASTGAPRHHVTPGGEDPDVEKEHKYTMSKMEQDILKNHLETQRRLITQKQVVAGIEFKGPAFKSNPETIEFKDFEVGKEYKKTVQLTNISYTVNTCKLVGLSEELKDFISIKFTPPGLMSAGIACSLIVTFEPQIDEDLFGEIEMLAQTGSFSIPIKCLKKRCIVEMNQCVVDFDRVCIGECATRSIVLKNIGALGTGFQIAKLPLVDVSLAEQSINVEREAVNVDDKLRAATPTSVIVQSEEQQESVDHELKENGVGVLDVKEKDDTSDVKDSVDAQHNKDEVPGEVGPAIELSKQGHDSEVIEGGDRPPDHTESSPPPATRQDPVSRESPRPRSSEQTGSLQLSDCVTIDPESGFLSSHSEVVLQVTFNPDRLGELDTTLSVDFSDDTVDRIIVHVKGSCVDIPVSVENDVTDFGICEVRRLYQTSLNFHNSSSKSIQMSFQIPKASQSYLDILPEQVALNPSSSSAVQVKFYPKSPLCSDVSEEQFRAEVMGRIPNQTLPVRFNILATLTTPSLEFGTSQMDFGCCGTQESVKCALDVTNKSLLPQQVGFIGLPNTVDVQPCDGFLTLLPLETVSLDVIVSPIKPGPFSFDLTCMTANGRKYYTPCKGSVVQSPLRLDSNTVYFAGTPVYSSAVATVTLMCDKTKHKGPKVTSRAFRFCLPDNSPVSVSPLAGIIAEGKKQKIQVQFQPKLDKLAVSTEADNLALQAEQEAKMILEAVKAKREEEAQKELMSSQKSRKTPGSTKGKPQKSGVVGTSETTCDVPHSIKIDPAHYHSAAQQKLLANYSTEELHLRIPCFVSSSDCIASTEQSYRREETIFLDVHARSVRPSLIVASQHGMTKMDFGKVVVGERIVKEIHIKNISNSPVEVVSPLLDPTGPFEILNAFRRIDPGRKHAIVVAFTPREPSDFFEPLHLTYGEGSFLNLTFSGKGVTCDVDVEGIEGGVIDFGHVLSGDLVTKMLKLKNNTPVPIGYAVTLDATTKEVSNFSGSSVFEFNPACGEITPGSTRDVTVTFLPDHPSLLYANRSHITINTENKAFQFHLKGKVWANSMYLLPGEIDPTLLESLLPQTHDQASLVVSFVRCLRDDTLSIASRQVEIGCIKSSSLKKSGGDYSFDPIQGTDAKCFTIEPMKATVEGGGHKMVTLSFTPPKGESHSTMEGNTVLTLKGEPNAQQIRVVLQGIVVD